MSYGVVCNSAKREDGKEQTMKCFGNCEYRRQSKLTIQFNEDPITAYCDNKLLCRVERSE